MNIEIDFESVNDVITKLETIKKNMISCYYENLPLNSYEGSKKEDIEGFINGSLITTCDNINSIIDNIINDIKKINGMYEEANLENRDTVNNLG